MCLSYPKGIYVTRVSPGGPAEAADLKMGDKIMQVCRRNEVLLVERQIHKMAVWASLSVGRELCIRSSAQQAEMFSKPLQKFEKTLLLPLR